MDISSRLRMSMKRRVNALVRRASIITMAILMLYVNFAVAQSAEYAGPPYHLRWGGDYMDGGKHASMEAAASQWWQLEIVDGWMDDPGCSWKWESRSPFGGMVIGVRSPGTYLCGDIEQSWGSVIAHTHHDMGNKNVGDAECCSVGNPVNSATGNKYQKETDYSVNKWLRIERHYNSSKEVHPGPFGKHWRGSYDARISQLTPTQDTLPPAVSVIRPDGKTLIFKKVNEQWTSTQDVTSSLEQNYSGAGEFIGWTYCQNGKMRCEEYSTDGLLMEIRDEDGLSTSLSYSDGNTNPDAAPSPRLLLSVVDPHGRKLVFTYDRFNRTKEILLPSGSRIKYGYGDSWPEFSKDTLESVTYQDGSSKQYVYNEGSSDYENYSLAFLGGIISEDGNRYSWYTYDDSGRVSKSSHWNEVNAHTFTYNPDGTTKVRYPSGIEVTQTFVEVYGRMKLSAVSDPCFPGCPISLASLSYDQNGFDDIRTDHTGSTTDYDHDERGLIVQKIEASRDTGGARRTLQTEWHASFDVPLERRTYNAANVLVAKSTWTYNSRGQALTSTRTDPATNANRTVTSTYCEQVDVIAGTCPLIGLTTSVDGPLTGAADTTIYTYYPTDDATCATAPTTCPHRKGDLWKVTNALGQVIETLRYDGAGRVLSVKDPNNVITDFEYHPRGWLTARKTRGTDAGSEADDQITRIEYWPTGLVKMVTQPDGAFTAYTYDAAHRLTDIADNAGNQIHYVLDNAGNRLQEDTKDAGGTLKRTLSRVYNQLGQLATQADAQANPTDFTYDANGNTNTVTDALGRVTDNDYDPLNRLARTLQDVGGIAAETKFQYDALDNLTKVTDPKGLDTTYTYNGLGDLTQLQSPDTGTTRYTYDSAGNRKTQTDARGVITQYDYDVLHRLTSIVYPDATLNIAYTYDAAPAVCATGEGFAIGRLSTMTDGSGSTQYCYDRFGHLIRKVQTTNGVTFVLRYSYTLAGQLQAMVYPDGTTVDHVRDAQGRTTEVGVTRTGHPRETLLHQASYHPFGPVASWSYGNGRQMTRSLDQDYRPLAVQDPGTGGLSLNFGFDAVGNLTQLTSGSPPPLTFVYDPLGRLTETRDGPTQTAIDTYSYDKTGNRTAHITAAGSNAYGYPINNHRLTDVGGVIRGYDAVGNTLTIGAAKEFVYNAANRMSQVKQGGMVTMNYAYNGRGEQVRKHIGTSNTYTLYDEGGHWLGDYDNTGAPIQQALWMDDLPVGLLANGNQLHYIQPDHLGTPRVVIDVARNVPVWTWDVKGEAFGNTAPDQNPDGDANAFVFDMRFPGQRYDAVSGLNYNYFRDYEAATGRYVEGDPIGLYGGFSLYAYAASAPTESTDKLGLLFERCPDGSVASFNFRTGKSSCTSKPHYPGGKEFYPGPTFCGSGWNEPLVPDNLPGRYSFKGACLNHDKCYEKCGVSKAACDSKFRSEMLAVCSQMPPGFWASTCRSNAQRYYSAVEALGSSAYENAQKQCTGCGPN